MKQSKLIIKSINPDVIIENPLFIPQIGAKITTSVLKTARVTDVSYDYTTDQEIITISVEVFENSQK